MKHLLLILALFVSALGFSQTEVKADLSEGNDTLVLISVDDYLQESQEVTDLYFRHGRNTNWIKLDEDGGRDLLKHYLSIDPEKYKVYKVYTRKLNKYYFVHNSKKTKRKKKQKDKTKAYIKRKADRAVSLGEAVISHKVMETLYAITIGRL